MKKEKIIANAVATGAAVASAAFTAKKIGDIKDKKFCPLCTAKKMLNKARINHSSEYEYSNGVALTAVTGVFSAIYWAAQGL